jgi:hypothetical protein
MKTINHSDQRDQLIYLDGEFVPHDRARVSVYDHGLLYGDGVYEGIRAYSGLVFQLTQHLDRLFRSARSLRLELPFGKHEAAQLVVELLRCNHLDDAYIRFIVTRGAGPIGPDPDRCGRPTVIVIAEALAGAQWRHEPWNPSRHRFDPPQRGRRLDSRDQVTELPQQHRRAPAGTSSGRGRGDRTRRSRDGERVADLQRLRRVG